MINNLIQDLTYNSRRLQVSELISNSFSLIHTHTHIYYEEPRYRYIDMHPGRKHPRQTHSARTSIRYKDTQSENMIGAKPPGFLIGTCIK